MLKKLAICAVLLMWVDILWGDDPPKEDPKPSPAVIVAPKEVSGTGKKVDPYIFTKATRCILELQGDVTGVKWDLEDAPTDMEILGNKYGSFSLYQDGLYQVTIYGGPAYSKVWFQIHSGLDPPKPIPDVDPVDPPMPAPVVGKLYVVIIRDGAHLTKLPSAQITAMSGVKIRDYCATHCLKGADGKTPEFRVYEPTTDVSAQSPGMQKAYKETLADMTKAGSTGPWLGVSNGTTGFTGPMPANDVDAIKKLSIYGGP